MIAGSYFVAIKTPAAIENEAAIAAAVTAFTDN
jgi:hypothetical protein